MAIRRPIPIKIQPGQMKGLMQAVDDNLLNWAYSPDCQNIEVNDGILSTRKGYSRHLAFETSYNIYTLKLLWVWGDEPDSVVVVVGTRDTATSTIKWLAYSILEPLASGITDPEELTGLSTLDPRNAKTIQYLIDDKKVLLLTARNGYALQPYKITAYTDGSSNHVVAGAVLGGTTSPYVQASNITMHRERIWVAHNHTIQYSNAYDAEDWTTAGETGSLEVNTDTGDTIAALENIFDDVLIMMRNSIKKISGDIPSEYSVDDVYAVQGAIYPDGICTDGNLCFYASSDGIFQYNGNEGEPILTDEVKDIYQNMLNVKMLLNNNKLYIFDKYTSAAGYVGTHLVYDVRKKTISVLKLDVVLYDATLFNESIYFASGKKVYVLDDTKILFDTTAITAYWYTPESDLGYPNAEKTLTDIYFTAWGTTSAGAAGGQVKITAYYKGLNGTQKTKEKTVTLLTTRKQHNIQFDATGRLFKFKIENVSGSAINLTGLEFVFELAED